MAAAEQLRDVLLAVSNLRDKQKVLRMSDAARFNIFGALNIEYRELSHSKFLAFLLDPNQSHDQGYRYLDSFLKIINIVMPKKLENIQVFTERPVRPFGQLDILIHIPSVLTICIENKVGARDQENQMGRYLSWLNMDVKTKGTRVAVYLSPDGRPPPERPVGMDSPPLRLLSYKTVAAWLEGQRSPERLSTVMKMYIDTCKKIAGVVMKNPYQDQIAELLSTPDQFAVALDIAEFIAAEKPLIVERFWHKTCKLLEEKLSVGSLSDNWKTHLSMEKLGWLAIVPINVGVDSANGSLGHAVTVEGIKSGSLYFGVRRGSCERIEAANRLDGELSRELAELHFAENQWWCGYRRMSEGGLLPDMPDANGYILLLKKYAQGSENPLAAQVADALWSLFAQCRERLEGINEAQTASRGGRPILG